MYNIVLFTARINENKMKQTAEDLQIILDLHKKWLLNEKGGERADLSGADLSGANKLPMYCKWTHGITDGLIHIGCEKRSIEEWDIFFESEEIIETPRNNDDFIQIQAVYNAYKAYLLTFKKEI